MVNSQTPLNEEVRDYFGLRHNIVVLLAVLLIISAGEELWAKFAPKFLETLGGGVLLVGLYGTLKDFLDAIYQYPGGVLADKLGRKRALLLFTALAIVGYAIYAVAKNPLWFFVGTFFVMAWASLSLPATFAIVGDSLPQNRRAIGFGVQSILKRLPKIIAPPLGGALILFWGMEHGFRVTLVMTIALAVAAMLVQWRFYAEPKPESRESRHDFWRTLRELNPNLKRLLVADCFARMAEGISEIFIVLWALDIVKVSALQFGWLVALEMAVAIAGYIPISKLADRADRRPFVLATFAFFALFPLAVGLSHSLLALAAAFAVGGLREIGEAPRKALIVDLAHAERRAQDIGVYYLMRGMIVMPAALIGGLLWKVSPSAPFFVASVVGLGALFVFRRADSNG